jgi:hypothetical protein
LRISTARRVMAGSAVELCGSVVIEMQSSS